MLIDSGGEKLSPDRIGCTCNIGTEMDVMWVQLMRGVQTEQMYIVVAVCFSFSYGRVPNFSIH
jgi:hypothetical protein